MGIPMMEAIGNWVVGFNGQDEILSVSYDEMDIPLE
jgi:hypothetical protein